MISFLQSPYYLSKTPNYYYYYYYSYEGELVNQIVKCYYIQCLVLLTLWFVLNPFIGFWAAFITATMQPLSRIPVFLMVSGEQEGEGGRVVVVVVVVGVVVGCH